MTTGETMYLVLVVGAFAVFMGVLALYAQQYRPTRRTATASAKPAGAHALPDQSHAR